jgi:NAD(P)H-hydrate repair Nnr-like enzyme with NAD(P)H-hydrate dehydratase domain
VVVLKGARTLVCDGMADDGFVTINPTGNPAWPPPAPATC